MVDRIRTILNREDISASKLADKTGVQRSSISHILSERNKPSLEFIQKILEAFPSINAEWLLTGKGGYLKTKENTTQKPPSDTPLFQKPSSTTKQPEKATSLFSEIKHGSRKKTVKVLTFYQDGTFDEYFPS